MNFWFGMHIIENDYNDTRDDEIIHSVCLIYSIKIFLSILNIYMTHIPNSVQNVEFLNIFRYGGQNMIINLMSLFSFIGARHVISDLYDHRRDLLCNPIIKVIILFSIIFVNIKDVKISILIFFIYICFIDNYIKDVCNAEYIDNTSEKNET